MGEMTPHTSYTSTWIRRGIPLIILLVGIAGTVLLVKSRKAPPRKAKVHKAMLVETVTVKMEQRKVQIGGNGVIQPRREISIAAEVSGKVRWINPALVVGGVIKKNQVLLNIDPTDFKLAVERTRASVALAEKNLAMAQSNASVARTEWKLLGKSGRKGEPNPLTLHLPQLKSAQSAMASANADLEQAKVSLSRATIRAPFNVRVRSKMVDLGQYVRTGQELARIYDTDVAEVIVSLPLDELRWLSIPIATRQTADKLEGPPVTVRLKTGETVYERQGLLLRSVGEVDATGRMSKVVVAITDPYNLQRESEEYLPDFEIGSFVEVLLEGKSLEQVMPIPARALHAGGVVWTVSAQSTLQIRKVKVARLNAAEALITAGLKPGERVVLTSVNGAVQGMKLRVESSKDPAHLTQEARRP